MKKTTLEEIWKQCLTGEILVEWCYASGTCKSITNTKSIFAVRITKGKVTASVKISEKGYYYESEGGRTDIVIINSLPKANYIGELYINETYGGMDCWFSLFGREYRDNTYENFPKNINKICYALLECIDRPDPKQAKMSILMDIQYKN